MSEPEYVWSTRAAYDAVAKTYHDLVKDDIVTNTWHRAFLNAFVEQLPGKRLLDAGSGPGHLTAYFAGLGLDTRGLDLSPSMIEVARAAYPHVSYEIGSITALPYADDSFDGVVSWYSIIHTPPQEQRAIFAEFARVLAPGGLVALAFHVGEEVRSRTEPYGHAVQTPLVSYRLRPDKVAEGLARVRLKVVATLVCEPRSGELVPQSYLLASRETGDVVA